MKTAQQLFDALIPGQAQTLYKVRENIIRYAGFVDKPYNNMSLKKYRTYKYDLNYLSEFYFQQLATLGLDIPYSDEFKRVHDEFIKLVEDYLKSSSVSISEPSKTRTNRSESKEECYRNRIWSMLSEGLLHGDQLEAFELVR